MQKPDLAAWHEAKSAGVCVETTALSTGWWMFPLAARIPPPLAVLVFCLALVLILGLTPGLANTALAARDAVPTTVAGVGAGDEAASGRAVSDKALEDSDAPGDVALLRSAGRAVPVASSTSSTGGTGNVGVWTPLLARLAADGFDRAALARPFAQPGCDFDPKPMASKLKALYTSVFGPARLKATQEGLAKLGYNVGKPDGRFGDRTAKAVRALQKDAGLPQDGVPDSDLRRVLARRLEAKGLAPAAEVAGWSPRVYQGVLTTERLAEAREFLLENGPVLRAAERAYGVPTAVVVGIMTVETRVGRYLGTRAALPTLASMAAAGVPAVAVTLLPEKKLHALEKSWLTDRARLKGDWAYDELKALLRYSQANGLDPLDMPSSIYGAIGIGQFMPTSVLGHGKDGDGDGRVDLFTVADAAHSVASYLKGYGWEGDMSGLEARRKVIYAYNHSQVYVNTVLAVVDALSEISPAVPAADPGRATVKAADAAELLAAMAPATRVVLADGNHDLSSLKGTQGSWTTWESRPEGLVLVVRGIQNMTLAAESGATLRFDGGAVGIRFENCPGLVLERLRLERIPVAMATDGKTGQASEPTADPASGRSAGATVGFVLGAPNAAVPTGTGDRTAPPRSAAAAASGPSPLLTVANASGVRLSLCQVVRGGLALEGVRDVRLDGVVVQEAPAPGLSVIKGSGLALDNLLCAGAVGGSALDLRELTTLAARRCLFLENAGSDAGAAAEAAGPTDTAALLALGPGCSGVTFRESFFRGNGQTRFVSGEGLALGPGNTFEDNAFPTPR